MLQAKLDGRWVIEARIEVRNFRGNPFLLCVVTTRNFYIFITIVGRCRAGHISYCIRYSWKDNSKGIEMLC